jgi:hypothetical protein
MHVKYLDCWLTLYFSTQYITATQLEELGVIVALAQFEKLVNQIPYSSPANNLLLPA